MMGAWAGFPSTRNDEHWPGAWRYGVDFAAESGSMRVIAIRFGDGDIKYGVDWIGPILLTEESAAMLEQWAKHVLNWPGGYVHLFPVDGDARPALEENLAEWREQDEE